MAAPAFQCKLGRQLGLEWYPPPPAPALFPFPNPLQDSVRKDLGVGDREWEACNMDVHRRAAGIPAHNSGASCSLQGCLASGAPPSSTSQLAHARH